MILTGAEILLARERSDLAIEPFEAEQVQPNAYDYRLAPTLHTCAETLDAAEPTATTQVAIPPDGYLLEPGLLYLGLTHERTASRRYVQLINGNRALGSLGAWVHVSAPLAHTGHDMRWTLEIRVVRPLRIYPLMRFGKIVFLDVHGAPTSYRNQPAKYTADAITSSRLHRELAR